MEENSELRKVIPSLARRAIEYYLKEGKYLPLPLGLPSYLISEKRGVFVSLKKKGRLRGCIGTYIPRYENIAQEIIHNAVSAATQDPRFPPLQEEELPFVSVSVDILSYPEEVNSLEELDPKKYGKLTLGTGLSTGKNLNSYSVWGGYIGYDYKRFHKFIAR